MERAAERIGVAPEAPRRRLADDDDQRRAGRRIGVRNSRPRSSGMLIAWKNPGSRRASRSEWRCPAAAATARSSRSASSCSCRCRTESRSTRRRRARPASRAATRAACGRTTALCSAGYFVRGSASWNVSRRSGWNPRLTCCSRSRLCVSRPAPISRMVASASSAAARPLRRRGRAPLDARVACLSTSFRSVFAACHAGAMPKSSPVAIVRASANSRTVRSTRTSGTGSRFAGITELMASTPHSAASNPTAPPMTESTRLSMSSCCSSRARLAPIAVRTAISFCRDAARASSRFATFAGRDQQHAADGARAARPARSAAAGSRRRDRSRPAESPTPSSRDTAGSTWPATTSISACACSSVTPGRRRPTARIT